MGYFITSLQLPDGASLERTDSVTMRLARQIREEPQVKDVIAVSGTSFVGGGNSSNVASLFVVLKPWNQRRGADNSVEAVIRRVDEL